jgi:xanthine dehydrogenase YagR molybdenum-binding subunit
LNGIGAGIDRVDGPAKVTGRAPYIGDLNLPRLAHAVLVLATIPKGRILAIDTAPASRMPGVMLVMTHANAPRLPDGGSAAVDPPAGRVLSLLQDAVVRYNREPIAVVVGESLEQATAGATAVTARYAEEAPQLDFAAGLQGAHSPGEINKEPADSERSGPAGKAARTITQTYSTPTEHHNPLEPHATVAQWNGDTLTLYDTTQGIAGAQKTIAKIFGLAPEQVRVICPYVGGGFGCKGSVWSHVPIAVMAARELGRPVKLVLERPQMFGPVGCRPCTEQRIEVAATADGRLTRTEHEVFSHTSVFEDFAEPAAMQTRILYACPNLVTAHRVVPLNVGTPTFQRAPGHATGTYALESALDELSIALAVDPIEMRLRNEPAVDPESHLPWSGRALGRCYAAGAAAFDWSRRNPAPRSMRAGGRLVGLGYATATYPARRSPAKARARITADGMVTVSSGTQDLGTGTYTVMTQVAAETLGFPLERVNVELGDSALPPAPVSGGSQSVASVAPAVQAACAALREKLVHLAIVDEASPAYGARPEEVVIENARVGKRAETCREPIMATLARQGGSAIVAEAGAAPGPEAKQYSMHSFGAVFVEVHVDPDLGELRVERVVGRYAIGRLLNAKTGRSQVLGGVVWGIGMALLEESLIDPHVGRVVNANLGEYHVPTNADIRSIDVDVVADDDQVVDPLGAKGIGEIGITGVAAAIANAVHHATGVRVRGLPITLDKLLV